MNYNAVAIGEIRDASPRILWAFCDFMEDKGFCNLEQKIYEKQCDEEYVNEP